ncbi:MAG: UDP-N-acetylglucosamine 2-epimerase, partial [Nitriliruptoraceae bacterium]
MPVCVFCGTAAEYIKLAPVLRRFDRERIAYRLIDSGQHAASAVEVRAEHGIRSPDVMLGGRDDVDSLVDAVSWMLRMARTLASRRRLRKEVFAGSSGVCVVHGDTLTTLAATAMARRTGFAVAHIESGLRSRSWLHPFPEEAIRVAVMRRAQLLFPPDATATANLEAMEVTGDIVELPANTIVESLAAVVGERLEDPGGGPALLTLHRVENLHRRRRLTAFVAA